MLTERQRDLIAMAITFATEYELKPELIEKYKQIRKEVEELVVGQCEQGREESLKGME